MSAADSSLTDPVRGSSAPVLHKGTVNAAIAATEERIPTMKHATLIVTAAALAIGSFAITAQASDGKVLEAIPATGERMSMSEVIGKLEAEGYRVDEIEFDDDGYYDVDLYDADGREIDVDIHPVTGRVLEWKADD